MILTTTYGTNINESAISDEVADVMAVNYSGYSFMEAAYKAMTDQQHNWNNLSNSIAEMELTYLKEYGVDIVYEAEEIVGKKTSLVSKGVEIVKDGLAKILGIINSWIANVNAKIAEKLWANPNWNSLKWPAGKSFTINDYFSAFDEVNSIQLVDDYRLLNKSVKDACGKDGIRCSVSQIINEHVKKITVNESYKKYTLEDYADVIYNYKDDIREAKELQNRIKKSSNIIVSGLKNVKKASSKTNWTNSEKNEFAQQVNKDIQEASQMMTFNMNLIAALLSIMTGRLKVAKTICNACGSKLEAEDIDYYEDDDVEESSLASALDFELV